MDDVPYDFGVEVHIAKDTTVYGDLRTDGRVVIEGAVEGSINADSMTIQKSGKVDGTATVNSADIAGQFSNRLSVDGTLTVRSSGAVAGTISYDNIELERGAQIYGEASLTTEDQPSSNSVSEINEADGTFVRTTKDKT